MTEYIDTTILKRKLDAWRTVPNYVYKALNDTPPANVVEREKIDKAIEEIVELGKEMNKVQFTKHLVPLDNILEILKRNLGE